MNYLLTVINDKLRRSRRELRDSVAISFHCFFLQLEVKNEERPKKLEGFSATNFRKM